MQEDFFWPSLIFFCCYKCRSDKLFCLSFQNTVTNADKLLAAADELAQTGECDANEIYGEARLLEERMHAFLSRVERRRNLLDMSVAFYTHVKEVSEVFCHASSGDATSWT